MVPINYYSKNYKSDANEGVLFADFQISKSFHNFIYCAKNGTHPIPIRRYCQVPKVAHEKT